MWVCVWMVSHFQISAVSFGKRELNEAHGDVLVQLEDNKYNCFLLSPVNTYSIQPLLDYCHTPNLQWQASLTTSSVFARNSFLIHQQTLRVDRTWHAHICTIFPSDELCSQRGVKLQYGLFIILLTKSSTCWGEGRMVVALIFADVWS